MVNKKRSRLGFQAPKPKAPKTAEEINRAYNEHAAQMGHKMRIIGELEEQVIDHRNHLVRLSAEANALPARPSAPVPSQAPSPQETV